MFNIVKKSVEWGGRELLIETGKVARQADGAVVVSYGGTKVLATVVGSKDAPENQDFFPLTCVYQEKTFAAGKIPGGFFKREGRPSEKEVLTSRLIDRPIRPLFDDGFFNNTQIICTVIQYDGKNDPDIVSMVGASACLAISGLPFNGPIAAARVAYIDKKYVLNPEVGFKEDTELDLVVAATKSSVMMVESEANELTEEEMLSAVSFAHDEMQPVIKIIEELGKEAGKERIIVEKKDLSDLLGKVRNLAEKDLRASYAVKEKQERVTKISEIKASVHEKIASELGDDYSELDTANILKKIEKGIVRGDLISGKDRIDGRKVDEVRDIVSEVQFLPQTHGSALFTRGETQSLVVTTLGSESDGQRTDSLDGDNMENFMLHYNFPPFSVGEASMLRSPGRREIGHGKLAWRALNSLIPSKEEFPYTIRIVSDITESNGSSSMATVCGGSLALMDAGVPIKRPCSGIAMGLIKEGEDFVVLSDILGDEDHLGDMDFKVAGTEKGITSLQMDIKIQGINKEIMKVALEQAKGGREHILGEMAKAIAKPREEVSDFAPKVTTIKINKDKIREVIGSGGKVIREICEVSGAKVDIEDDGTVSVAAVNKDSSDKALNMINEIIAEPEVGEVYNDCKVIKIVDFGAFVEFFGKQQGLVHISEIAEHRVEKVEDEIKEGDLVKVVLLNIDRQGKMKLSMKRVNQETGEKVA